MAAQYKYLIDLILQTQGFTNNMNKVQSQMKGMENAAKRVRTTLVEMAGALGFSYGLGQLTQLVQQTIQLAAKAEGVKSAFDRLDNPALLNNLRKATSGTVSDLDLMTKAVQARNFKISMEALPTYFKFATQRALETGQAVDYLVESLVIGVGRKSVLWLDNLGLSTIQINEELKKTPDFAEAVGKVIEKEMSAAGKVADTTATKIQSVTASWENMKLKMGESILGQGGAGMMGVLSDWLEMISSSNITGGEKIKNWIDTLFGGDNLEKWKDNKKAAEEYFAALDKANTMRYIMTYSKDLEKLDEEGQYLLQLAIARYKEIKAAEEGQGTKEVEVRTLETINEELSMYNELLMKTPVADKASIKSHLEHIKTLEDEKKAIMGLADAQRVLVSAPGKIKAPGVSRMGGSVGSGVLAKGPSKPIATKAQEADAAMMKLADSLAILNNVEDPFQFLTDSMDSLIGALEQGGESFQEYAANVSNAIREIIGALLAESVATAISTALKSAKFAGPAGVFLIPVLAAAGAGLAKTAFNSLIPKFAEGALVSGPTVGVMGEYPGARSGNPEVIAPLNKLQAMLQVNNAVPNRMRIALDGQGNLYGYLQYRERRLNNYK